MFVALMKIFRLLLFVGIMFWKVCFSVRMKKVYKVFCFDKYCNTFSWITLFHTNRQHMFGTLHKYKISLNPILQFSYALFHFRWNVWDEDWKGHSTKYMAADTTYNVFPGYQDMKLLCIASVFTPTLLFSKELQCFRE